MFNWAMDFKRRYVTVNPCPKLLEDDKAVEKADIEDGRVLTADELRTFWFGVDDPNSPGDRLSKLALKLSLVTLLRTGECVCVERERVTPSNVTIPLKKAKGRRSKKARDVVQPLNSLAREISWRGFLDWRPRQAVCLPRHPRARPHGAANAGPPDGAQIHG